MTDNALDTIQSVLIVGGGVGGLAVAIRLLEAGKQVDLIDLDEDWKAAGTGVTLSHLTTRALADLGLAEDLKREGHIHNGVTLFTQQGDLIMDNEAPMLPQGIHAEGGILRPILHRIMSQKVLDLGANVTLGLTVDAYTQDDNGVDITFSDGNSSRYDLVIGADGLFSKMRDLTFPDAPKPRFTGQACWRVLFDLPEHWEKSRMYLGPVIKVGFTPCAPDKMYMYLLEHVPGNPWVEPETFAAKLHELLAGFGGELAELRDKITPDSDINYRPLEAILLDAPWYKGRVILIGDAAHATTPHLGSGAGMAVEDAIVLVDELSNHATINEAFAAFMARRLPRGQAVVGNSLKLGELEMAHAPQQEQAALMGESLGIIAQPY